MDPGCCSFGVNAAKERKNEFQMRIEFTFSSLQRGLFMYDVLPIDFMHVIAHHENHHFNLLDSTTSSKHFGTYNIAWTGHRLATAITTHNFNSIDINRFSLSSVCVNFCFVAAATVPSWRASLTVRRARNEDANFQEQQ